METIILLWPCYGLILLSFTFFMGSIFLFLGCLCNSLVSNKEQYDSNISKTDDTFSVAISFFIFLNCTCLFALSCGGFLIVFYYLHNNTVLYQGFSLIISILSVTVLVTILKFKRFQTWYKNKVLKSSIISEFIDNEPAGFSRSQVQRDDQHQDFEQRDDSRSMYQDNNITNEISIIKQDLIEISKIELLDEQPRKLQQQILSQVPRVIVKVSNSYYQKLEQYSKTIIEKFTKVQHTKPKISVRKQKQKQITLQSFQTKANLYSMQKNNNKKKISNNKLQIETDVDKLSVADEKQIYEQTVYKLSQHFNFKETIEDRDILDLEEPDTRKIKQDDDESLYRVCFTSRKHYNLNPAEYQNTQEEESKVWQRRLSFDMSELRKEEDDHKIYPRHQKNQLLQTLKSLNQEINQSNSYTNQTQKTNQDLMKTSQQELKRAKEMCMLCLEKQGNAVILECGHGNVCFMCAFKLYRTQEQCHLCRQPITKIIKVNRSEGLDYQKVEGVLQKVDGKFYYSDVTREICLNNKNICLSTEVNELENTTQIQILDLKQ